MTLTNENLREEIIKNLELCESNPEHFLKIYDKGFISVLSENRVILDLVDELETENFSKRYLEPLCAYIKDTFNLRSVMVSCGDFRKPRLTIELDDSPYASVKLDILNAKLESHILCKIRKLIEISEGSISARNVVKHESKMYAEKQKKILENYENASTLTKICRMFVGVTKKDLAEIKESHAKLVTILEESNKREDELESELVGLQNQKGIKRDMLNNLAKGFETYGYSLEHKNF